MKKRTFCETTFRGATALAALSLGLAGASQAAPNTQITPPTTSRTAWGSRSVIFKSVILKIDGALTPAREARLRSFGADVTRHLSFIGSVAATVPTRTLAQIATLPFVTHVSSDGSVKKCDEFTCASSGADRAYQQYGLTGQGVTVAVLDSGIRSNADIRVPTTGKAQLIGSFSFIPNDTNTDDLCGHGTHVAGIIAGNGAASTGSQYTHTFYGIARNANLVSVRVLDANGQGSVGTVLEGLQWVVKNKSAYNIRVLNLSLGHPVGESYLTDPLCQGVEAAWKAGIVVVCAAGNSGRASATQKAGAANEGWGTAYGSIQSPGNDPYVITVGATKSVDGNHAHDRIATYSSRGPSRLDLVLKPDIIAPGNKVISTYSYNSNLFQYNSANNNGLPAQYYTKTTWTGFSTDYFRLSGTSMAAPVVAGAAALLLQATPNLSPDTIKARLMIAADKWAAPASNGTATGQADPCTYGAGYLDIPAALQSTVVATKSALSPTLMQDASGNVYLNTSWIMSASHIIWGTSVNDLHIIWGTNAISGSTALTASHIIWGTSVFSDHIIWGTSTSAVDLTSVAIYGE
jgi:serine protease AprX